MGNITKLEIPVSKPYLPKLDDIRSSLETIFSSGLVTNNGVYVRELESRLKDYIGAKHLFLVANGTLAQQLAIKAMQPEKQIVCTPFSAIPTLSSMLWEGYEPIFADIDPDTLCMSVSALKQVISTNTSLVVATHVYGNCCDVDGILKTAHSVEAKVLFDASHAFGSFYKGKNILGLGDVIFFSTHAYKLFHTIEGGVIATNDDVIAAKIYEYRYFGLDKNNEVKSVGINAKTSELNAIIGLEVLNHLPEILASRKEQYEQYRNGLRELPVKLLTTAEPCGFNYAYFPIILETEKKLLQVQKSLSDNGIIAKRYFYPSLNKLPILKTFSVVPISENIAPRILCLPMYHDLSLANQNFIIAKIKDCYR